MPVKSKAEVEQRKKKMEHDERMDLLQVAFFSQLASVHTTIKQPEVETRLLRRIDKKLLANLDKSIQEFVDAFIHGRKGE